MRRTLVSKARLQFLAETARKHVGAWARQCACFVECGVWRGGSAGAVAPIMQAAGCLSWLFDSFQTMPDASENDVDRFGRTPAALRAEGLLEGDKSNLKATEDYLYDKLNCDSRWVRVIPGWFENTLPRHDTGPIGLLHLDCDFYEPVKFCVQSLHSRVIPGGIVVVDDYGHWRGCKKAIDEFLSEHPYTLCRVDRSGRYWVKE